MGYTTEFEGQFNLDRPLTPEQAAYLRAFAGSRRMKRDASKTAELDDPQRVAVGLPVGTDGEFYVGTDWGRPTYGQTRTDDIVDYNSPPSTQPSLWCQWVPTDDNKGIEWDGGEKFYSYVEWLNYIIANFLKSWGYTLNGEVTWEGEDRDDLGKIVVTDNEVTTKEGKVVYD